MAQRHHDEVDIRNGVKIEGHYYTPAQLKTDVPKGWKNINSPCYAEANSMPGCLLRVKLRSPGVQPGGRLYPQLRTWPYTAQIDALCQYRPKGLARSTYWREKIDSV